MPQNCVIRDLQRAPDQLLRLVDLLPRKADRLRIGKIERCREIDRQIVTDLILRKRRAVAVCDLAARRRYIENVSARQLLRLECWNDRLFFGRLAS